MHRQAGRFHRFAIVASALCGTLAPASWAGAAPGIDFTGQKALGKDKHVDKRCPPPTG